MLRSLVRVGLALTVLVVMAGPLQAQRRGFIIGGGLGPGTTSGDLDTKIGITTEFKIGGMIGQSIQLYYANRVNWTDSDFGDVQLTGVGGLGVTYQMENQFRINGLVGLASRVVFLGGDTSADNGFGFGAGVGYEFAKHWIVGLDGSYGRISGENLFNVALTINVLSH